MPGMPARMTLAVGAAYRKTFLGPRPQTALRLLQTAALWPVEPLHAPLGRARCI